MDLEGPDREKRSWALDLSFGKQLFESPSL